LTVSNRKKKKRKRARKKRAREGVETCRKCGKSIKDVTHDYLCNECYGLVIDNRQKSKNVKRMMNKIGDEK